MVAIQQAHRDTCRYRATDRANEARTSRRLVRTAPSSKPESKAPIGIITPIGALFLATIRNRDSTLYEY